MCSSGVVSLVWIGILARCSGLGLQNLDKARPYIPLISPRSRSMGLCLSRTSHRGARSRRGRSDLAHATRAGLLPIMTMVERHVP